MQQFTQKEFNIKNLKDISDKNIEEHLKLYAGYVKNANLILEHIEKLSKEKEEYSYEIAEIQRRFAFEFCGMRNHEYYFSSLEGGSKALESDSKLKKMIQEEWGSFEKWLEYFKNMAMTRGVGWAMLYYDKQTGNLLNQWVDEQHLGNLISTTPILCLDMWEHAYVYDYPTSEKKKYIEAFFENLNWNKIEDNLNK
jgi:Fe-Mn family superoxide dismutase